MPLNYTEVNLSANYALFGVETQFVLLNDDMIELVAIDKTNGVMLQDDNNDLRWSTNNRLGTMRPACSIRVQDLVDLELEPEDIMEAILEMNGTSWKVQSYIVRPSPNGVADGELYLILMEAPASG